MRQDIVTAELTEEQKTKLTKLGFTGTDASMDISLFEYDGLYSEKLGLLLIHRWNPKRLDNHLYDTQEISREEVIEQIKNSNPAFFGYVGVAKVDYLKSLIENEVSINIIISELENWSHPFCEILYYQGLAYDSLDELIKITEDNANENRDS